MVVTINNNSVQTTLFFFSRSRQNVNHVVKQAKFSNYQIFQRNSTIHVKQRHFQAPQLSCLYNHDEKL